jgi:hypothetical protein
MDLSLITARLKSQLTGLRSIGSSADLVAAQAGTVALPGAFLLPLGDDGGPDAGLIGVTHQVITQTFGVVLGLINKRDAQGAAALDDLVTLRNALKTALIGWVPDATVGEPVLFAGGRLQSLDKEGRLWWMDEFRLVTYYRSA